MSDSESDPDLTISRYEEDDDLNCYGSPVQRPDDEEHTPVKTAESQLALPTVDTRTQVSDSF
jgi:hypothetical protein